MQLSAKLKIICRAVLPGLALLTTTAEAQTPPPQPEFILYQGGTSSRQFKLLEVDPATGKMPNLEWANALPVDGIVLSLPASYTYNGSNTDNGPAGTTLLKYNDVFTPWLKPLIGSFTKLNHSYFLVALTDMGDPLDDWSAIKANWITIATAARNAGLEGFYFDDENPSYPKAFFYNSTLRHLDTRAVPPTLTKFGNKYYYANLALYHKAFRDRGTEIMTAIKSVWPTVKYIQAHGPTVSEPCTPDSIAHNEIGADAENMRGHWFTGLLKAAPAKARVISGGEFYRPRTVADFQAVYDWHRGGITAPQPCMWNGPTAYNGMIPPYFVNFWKQNVKVAQGLYDRSLPDAGIVNSPQIVEDTIVNAYAAKPDGPVWLFTDGLPQGPQADAHDYLLAADSANTQPFIDAIRRARARVAALPH